MSRRGIHRRSTRATSSTTRRTATSCPGAGVSSATRWCTERTRRRGRRCSVSEEDVMRITRLTWTAALLLFATSAIAQTPVPPFPMQPPAATDVAQTLAAPGVIGGTADFGGLFTTTDGDAARFERYRDTRDGVYSN